MHVSDVSPHCLPCGLSLVTVLDCCLFSDINISQGSVATYVRCGRLFNDNFTTNLH